MQHLFHTIDILEIELMMSAISGGYRHRLVGVDTHKLMGMNWWCFWQDGVLWSISVHRRWGQHCRTCKLVERLDGQWSATLFVHVFCGWQLLDRQGLVSSDSSPIAQDATKGSLFQRKIIMLPSKFAMCPSYIGWDLLSPMWQLHSDINERWYRASALWQ